MDLSLFWRCSPMAATRSRKRSRSTCVLQKPRGTFHPRVQKVGPEHFGIVCFDCAKARSKWMLCDFYGKILSPPTEVEHTRRARGKCEWAGSSWATVNKAVNRRRNWRRRLQTKAQAGGSRVALAPTS